MSNQRARVKAAMVEDDRFVIEATEVVAMQATEGGTTLTRYGWECAPCQEVTGLVWDTREAAQDSLDEHLRLANLPAHEHQGDVRASDDGHVFTGWCSCGWEGEDHDAGTNRRRDERHADAEADAEGELRRHHDDVVSLYLRHHGASDERRI